MVAEQALRALVNRYEHHPADENGFAGGREVALFQLCVQAEHVELHSTRLRVSTRS